MKLPEFTEWTWEFVQWAWQALWYGAGAIILLLQFVEFVVCAAAREAGADMTKEEFGRVIGGLAKPKPERKPEPERPDE